MVILTVNFRVTLSVIKTDSKVLCTLKKTLFWLFDYFFESILIKKTSIMC